MTRRGRTLVLAAGLAGTVLMLVVAIAGLPRFGSTRHPYRDLAVPAAVAHATANVVASINFDQRGLDTLGEESILLASVLGAAALLRPGHGERETEPRPSGRTLESTRLGGYLLLPLTLLTGLDVIAYGHLTPGGGFQGGVVLGTGIHLLYVAGAYPALRRASPLPVYEWGEAIGAGAFAALGTAGTVVAGAFLRNIIDQGSFGHLLSSGTVLVLNAAVGIEVASGTVVLLAQFLIQDLRIVGGEDGEEGQ